MKIHFFNRFFLDNVIYYLNPLNVTYGWYKRKKVKHAYVMYWFSRRNFRFVVKKKEKIEKKLTIHYYYYYYYISIPVYAEESHYDRFPSFHESK